MLFKMKSSVCATMLAAGALVLFAGCGEPTVTQKDVQEAQEKVNKERRETEEARQKAMEEVGEKQREFDQDRHETMKPIIEDAEAEIREEQQETREAEEKLNETQAKFNTQQARDEYVTLVEEKLEEADLHIEQLKERAADLENSEEADRQIEELEGLRDRVETELDELKSADVPDWKDYQQDVDQAISQFNAKMGRAQ